MTDTKAGTGTAHHKQIHTARSPRLTLNITAELIATAKRRDSGHCMISEAVKVAYPGAARVRTDLQTIGFTDPDKGLRYHYLTPRLGQEVLVGWDAGAVPEPFTLRIQSAIITRSHTRQSKVKKDARADRVDRRVHLVDRGQPSKVPERIGGQAPPVGALASPPARSGPAKGRRREFGLRGLTR